MKRYIKYILTVAVMAFLLLELTVFTVIMIPGGTFHSSFQSLIIDKYRILQRTNEPKIIMVCGSSGAFGVDQQMLEDATGYKVANLGLHAGFGHLFHSELAKENINEGDIVLLAYEYGWQDGFEYLDQSLIMSAIDDNIDMYKHIPMSHWPDFIGYLFKYAATKNSFEEATGNYSREAFDSKTAQMILPREYEMDYENNADYYGHVDLSGVTISKNAVSYLKDFKAFAEEKGAKVYFIAPPLFKEAVDCDPSEFQRLKEMEESEIGIPYISDPTEYLFEKDLMYNALYHCSSEGEKVRTQLIIDDLKRAGVID